MDKIYNVSLLLGIKAENEEEAVERFTTMIESNLYDKDSIVAEPKTEE